jgi:hypothetical protein
MHCFKQVLIAGSVMATHLARYVKNVAIGFNQLLNTLLGGEPDECLSSHAYRLD